MSQSAQQSTGQSAYDGDHAGRTGGGRSAVLLMAYGTPYKTEDIMGYYTNIRHGSVPSGELYEDLKRRYNAIGGTSPLAAITENQAAGLQKALDHDRPNAYVVCKGFKYIAPFISDAVDDLAAQGVTQVYGLPLAPHYSSYSSEDYHNRAKAAIEQHEGMVYHPIRSWWKCGGLVDFWADQLNGMRNIVARPDTKVIFSAHSLPMRIIEGGDPYRQEIIDMAHAVARAANLDDSQFTIAWQSAGRTGEEWIGPDFKEVAGRLVAQEGVRTVVSASIGFIADNLEILDDIDIELKKTVEDAGGSLMRLKMPNADPKLIEALEAAVLDAGE